MNPSPLSEPSRSLQKKSLLQILVCLWRMVGLYAYCLETLLEDNEGRTKKKKKKERNNKNTEHNNMVQLGTQITWQK